MTSRIPGMLAASSILLPAVSACSTIPGHTSGAPAADATPLIQALSALAWPVAALLIALLFRRPLAALVTAIGGRITKLSLFKVEIELLPAEGATAPMLNELKSAAVATVNDSSALMLQQVQEGGPALFAVIDLGQGQDWLTSRLYVAAIMLERMRGVRALLFLEDAPPTKRRFVAIAPVGAVRWALAQRYPWLEGAWLNANLNFAQRLSTATPQDPPTIKSQTGALDTEVARTIVRTFINQVHAGAAPPPPLDKQWTLLPAGSWERAAWLDRKSLQMLLPSECFEAWAPAMRDEPRSRRTRAILRRTGEFIALVESDNSFAGLIVDRNALLEQLAATTSEEPEAK